MLIALGRWSARGIVRGRVAALFFVPVALGGCAALYTMTAERDLEVETRMTDSLFVDPVPETRRVVYLEVRNVTGRPDFDIADAIAEGLSARGWRVAPRAEDAELMLQVSVLAAGRKARTAAERAYGGSLESALLGAAGGGAAGYAGGRTRGNEVALGIGGALAGAAAGTVTDAFVRSIDYAVVSDVQLAQRTPGRRIVQGNVTSRLPQGRGANLVQSWTDTSSWRRYRTRVISAARQANLDWSDAGPALSEGHVRSIAGLL